ncbi:MAG TPA: hypothetical protein VK463_15580 [Desulfomonilaceae bacterium]|nr:hypothetical protein [Desulfomonilaceae bacterium]
MTDEGKNEMEHPGTEEEPEVQDYVHFSDRVIAFLILIFPFSFFVDRLQSLLLEHVSQYVNNMIVLAGLVGFLVLVGWLSKKVHGFRKRRETTVEKS